jgi:hypothetical protein
MTSIDSVESVESMLSRVKNITWAFTDVDVETYVSCLAFSVEDARQRLLSYLVQIESLQDEKNALQEKSDALWQQVTDKTLGIMEAEEQVQLLSKQLLEKLPPIRNRTGYNCTPLLDYTRSMEVVFFTGKEAITTTLGEMIANNTPSVHDIYLTTFGSRIF